MTIGVRLFAVGLVTTGLVTSGASAQMIVSTSRSTPWPGVTMQSGDVRLGDGTTSYDAALVQLCTSHVHVAATAPATSLRTTASWAGSAGVQVAVNGDFFANQDGSWFVYGDAVGNGRRWPLANRGDGHTGWWNGHRGWLAFGDGWVELGHTGYVLDHAAAFEATLGFEDRDAIPAHTTALVSGFPELVTEGRVYTCPDATGACFPDRSDMRARHPRTAAGVSANRRTLILLTIDGRNGRSSGALGVELAAVMHELGAWQAFNLDGGGSSSMWRQGAGYVNDPSDGAGRSVMNHLGVFAGSGSGSAAEPGSCFVAGGCFATRVAGAEGELFEDLPPGALGSDAAAILFRAGITSGCQQTPHRMFCPNCDATRRQFVVMLIKAAGIAHPAVTTSSFTDVPDDDWALPYIEAAAREGITAGCGDGVFCPDDPVTRGQAAAFINRATGWPATRPTTPTFADVPADHTFFGAIETIADRCVTSGCGGGNYCPQDPVTRAQTAIFLAKAFDLEDYNTCFDPPTDPVDPTMDPDGAVLPASDGGVAPMPGPDAGPRADPGGDPTRPPGGASTGSLGSGCSVTNRAPVTTAALLGLLSPLALLFRRRLRASRRRPPRGSSRRAGSSAGSRSGSSR